MPDQAIGGIASVRADGRQYALRGSFMVSPSPSERTGVAGMDGVHGYTEAPRVPYIAGTISTTIDLSVEELQAISSATVQADLINGRSYVLRDAWTKSAFEIDTAAGSISVRWEGMSCDEL